MERLELWIAVFIGGATLLGLIWKVIKLVVVKISKPFCDIKKKLDEIIELSTHNGTANRYLLKYRIEQLCFKAFANCKRTGTEEIDKDVLTTINNMHAEYKYFGGNSTIDKLVERVNQLHIVD